MNLGLELITESTLSVRPDHQFRLELYAGEELTPLAVGTDTYSFNCNILPHKIVAATGRDATHEIGMGLGAFEADKAKSVPVQEKDLPQLRLRIINNRILDQAELKHGFSLRLKLAGKTHDILLARPDVRVYWDGRGDFNIPLGPHVA